MSARPASRQAPRQPDQVGGVEEWQRPATP